MAASDYLLSIMAVFQDKATGELKKFSGGLGNVGREAQRAKPGIAGIGDAFKGLALTMTGVGVAAVGLKVLLKKAFDLGEEGAAIQQTEDSFKRLLVQIDAAPNLLNQLRAASRDTISDMDLMSATTTLLAGAQGELAQALAGATPRLMEIAKAANALNPTLGDTTFLYNSLATGIKRASPMILDNLGLTIKIGQAYEDYAKTLGKTAQELTAEEQKMALLNETLRAGSVLVEQAGGSADSAVDDFKRLEAAIKNISDAFKKELAPSIADAAGELADYLLYHQRLIAIATEEERAILDLGDAYWDYVEARQKQFAILQDTSDLELTITSSGALAREYTAWEKFNYWVRGLDLGAGIEIQRDFQFPTEAAWEQAYAHQALIRETATLVKGNKDLVLGNVDVSQSLWTVADDEAMVAIKAQDLVYQNELLNQSFSELAMMMRGAVGTELDDYSKTQEDLEGQAIDLRAAIEAEEGAIASLGGPRGYGGLQESLEGLQGAFLDVEERMHALGPAGDRPWQAEQHMREMEVEANNIIVAIDEVEAAMGEVGAQNAAWDGHSQKLIELREQLAETEGSMDELAESHRQAMREIMFDMVMVRIGQEDWMGDGLTLATTLAESWGLIDEATAEMMHGVNAELDKFDTNRNLDRAVASLTLLGDRMDGMPNEWDAVRTAVGRELDDVSYWSLSAQGYISDAYTGAGTDIETKSQDVNEKIEEVQVGLDDLVKEPYRIDLDIKDRPVIIDALGGMENSTRYLSTGTHQIVFDIITRGTWPGGSGVIPGIPPMQAGGIVPATGPYLMHAGELVIPAMETQQASQGGGDSQITYGATNNFNLNVTSIREARSILQEFEIMRALAGA